MDTLIPGFPYKRNPFFNFHLTTIFPCAIKAACNAAGYLAANHSLELRSSVAQLVERVAVNHLVGGSSPSRGASFKPGL